MQTDIEIKQQLEEEKRKRENPKFLLLKAFSSSQIIIMCVVIFGLAYAAFVLKKISTETFWYTLGGIGAMILILMSKKKPTPEDFVTVEEARTILRNYLFKCQSEGNMPEGRIIIEQSHKADSYNGKPFNHHIGFKIISVYGLEKSYEGVISCTPPGHIVGTLDCPERFTGRDIKDFVVVVPTQLKYQQRYLQDHPNYKY